MAQNPTLYKLLSPVHLNGSLIFFAKLIFILVQFLQCHVFIRFNCTEKQHSYQLNTPAQSVLSVEWEQITLQGTILLSNPNSLTYQQTVVGGPVLLLHYLLVPLWEAECLFSSGYHSTLCLHLGPEGKPKHVNIHGVLVRFLNTGIINFQNAKVNMWTKKTPKILMHCFHESRKKPWCTMSGWVLFLL